VTRQSRTFSLRLLLSLMLLIAQVGAVAHAYAHVSSGGDSFGAPIDTVQLCGQCQSSLPLFAAAKGPDRIFEFDPADACSATPSRALSLIEARLVLAFRSRAPPILL
jgi:hypothetical protein